MNVLLERNSCVCRGLTANKNRIADMSQEICKELARTRTSLREDTACGSEEVLDTTPGEAAMSHTQPQQVVRSFCCLWSFRVLLVRGQSCPALLSPFLPLSSQPLPHAYILTNIKRISIYSVPDSTSPRRPLSLATPGHPCLSRGQRHTPTTLQTHLSSSPLGSWVYNSTKQMLLFVLFPVLITALGPVRALQNVCEGPQGLLPGSAVGTSLHPLSAECAPT